jgi:RPA family protein
MPLEEIEKALKDYTDELAKDIDPEVLKAMDEALQAKWDYEAACEEQHLKRLERIQKNQHAYALVLTKAFEEAVKAGLFDEENND